ncbi:MAG: deoxyguanosinetriphosphate triphosphohydrolase [Candidatus Hydrogenedentes bacterium]|nr:deoxyguanosinetriphosphate triphosphohydrolase [Candidatus Hydrogenedentota bacterium]
MATPTRSLKQASAKTVREMLEDRERAQLAPFATFAGDSRGRQRQEKEHDYRTAFQRDRDRILHTKSFRRLKQKTQVFLAPKGDHYRTRLTHTLEVAQISRTVARALFVNEDLTEAIALGHDLGHTPFGHAGEVVLNEAFAEGFRHYEQSLRVVDTLETRRSGGGLNLTHEVREGILNHSVGKVVLLGKAAKSGTTPEATIVSVCDAIAYINHDIEDAVRGGLITLNDLPKDAIELLGRASSQRINRMVIALIEGSQDDGIGMIEDVRQATVDLRAYLYTNLYPCEAINREVRKAKKLLKELYYHFLEHPSRESSAGNPDDSIERRTVDFIAGMTDPFALEVYRHLFFPDSWPAR